MSKVLILICLIASTTASFAAENIISSLLINDDDEREIEVVMDKNKMYLPCKYILNYFEVPYKENHVNKSLSFKNTTISANSCIINGVKQAYPVFFVKTGIDGSQNEFFMSAEALSKILEKRITSDSHQLIAFIKTKDTSKKSVGDDFLLGTGGEKIGPHDEITLPVQKGWISLDSVGVRNNVLSDSYSQMYKDTQSKYCSFSNNVQTTFMGKLNSGEYKVDVGTNSYTQNMFAFSGISPTYKNKFRNYDYVIGKVDPWNFGDNNIGSDIMGAQLKDHVEKTKSYRDIEGYVNPNSTVKVYINDDFEKELNTYGGYYSLKDLYYNGKITKIKIDEILPDGTKKEIFSQAYKDDYNKKKVPKKDFILGITGLQNRLWASNGYLYQNAAKKYVAGFKDYKELNDKLTFENFVIADKIFDNTANGIWNQSIMGNKRYLNYAVMRNLNALDGQTYMGVLSYKNNEKMDSKLYFGGSNCAANDGITDAGLGYFLQYENNYHINKTTTLKESLFASSPNFYMAGSSTYGGGFLSDKVGAGIGGNTEYKNVSLSGTYSKYESNFGNYFDGGLLNVNEYNLTARAHFKKLPSVSLRINNRNGENGIGNIDSESYELSADKRIKCFDNRAGILKNIYSTQYSAADYSSYSSEYSDIFIETNFPLGKRFGTMTLGHDIVNTISDSTTTNYNEIKIAYSTPCIKGFNFTISTGFHYAGDIKGNDWGFGVTKRLKSGSTISLNYRYSQIPFYMIDNMYIPASMHHSITLDFAELYGIGGRGMQAIGTGNENKGYLEAVAFLDVNQNGVKDKGEPYIENIPIKVENDSELLLTGKNGKTHLKAEEAGVHNVQIFEDELPTFISCHNKTKPSRFIKVTSGSKTKVAFGLTSTVGNINGSVTVKDEFNNSLRIEDLVVSILDTSGKEINYTNINEDGTFSFSGISPGKYVIEVDKELQDAYKIKPDAKSENYIVVIPPEYKDYVNIDNVNLNYKYEI